MPLFMDFHQLSGVTVDDVKKAHIADLSVQDQFGVYYHQFWVNEGAGTVFCLVEGPDMETCQKVHQIAHGNIPCAMTQVEPGYFRSLMGSVTPASDHLTRNVDGSIDLGYRYIVAISVRQLPNPAAADDERKTLDILKLEVRNGGGREIPWGLDDTILSVYNDATAAIDTCLRIQAALQEQVTEGNLSLRMAVGGDQPLTADGVFFSRAVKTAHRLCSTALEGKILITSLVSRACKHVATLSPKVISVDKSDEEFITKLFDIVDKDFTSDGFSIDGMCREIGISRPQLYRKITTLSGRAPNMFLRDIRLEKAFALLKDKSSNISQIALTVGFSNPSYFAKCFAEKFGFTPSTLVSTAA